MISAGIASSSNTITAKVPGKANLYLSWNTYQTTGILNWDSEFVDNIMPPTFLSYSVYASGVLKYTGTIDYFGGQITLYPYESGYIVGRAGNQYGLGPESEKLYWTGAYA